MKNMNEFLLKKNYTQLSIVINKIDCQNDILTGSVETDDYNDNTGDDIFTVNNFN